MAEYIEKTAVLNAIDKLPNVAGYCFFEDDVVDMVRAIPAADVVAVVRCKDCKHYHASEGWCDEHSSFIDGRGVKCHPWESSEWRMFNEDDFCSYGEREEG